MSTAAEADRLLTADDLAQRWQVDRSHIYRLARDGSSQPSSSGGTNAFASTRSRTTNRRAAAAAASGRISDDQSSDRPCRSPKPRARPRLLRQAQAPRRHAAAAQARPSLDEALTAAVGLSHTRAGRGAACRDPGR